MNLKSIRLQCGKTQKQVAEDLNMKRDTLSRYETGQIEPSVKTLITLANYYQVSLDYLCAHPHPYDNFSSALPAHRKLIKKIPELTLENTIRVTSYCDAILDMQKEESKKSRK